MLVGSDLIIQLPVLDVLHSLRRFPQGILGYILESFNQLLELAFDFIVSAQDSLSLISGSSNGNPVEHVEQFGTS